MFFICQGPLMAQNFIGLPEVTNYSTRDFHGGTQTWSVQQGKNGLLYFANNDGLLSFDGSSWKQYSLPNHTIVRSIAIDPATGFVFTGGQNEFGFFAPGDKGDLVYTSLKSLVPAAYKEFADIWHIESAGGAVFFRANKKIFEYRNNRISVHPALSEWRYMKTAGNRLLAQDRQGGIMEYKKHAWQSLCKDPVLKEGLITGILPYDGDTLMVTTLKDGLFLLEGNRLIPKRTDADAIFRTARIYCATNVNADEIAFGTTSSGCYIVNREGRVTQMLSRTEGLQNNNILTLFTDKNLNLWMGLDNGIDFAAYNSAIKKILPDKSSQLAGYAIKIFKNVLYVGTSDGLYTVNLRPQGSDLSFSKGNFARVPNTNGQVWRLDELDGQLMMGHHDGGFMISGNKVVPVLSGVGSWLFNEVSPASPAIIAGTYNGLELFERQGSVIKDRGKVEGITESLRFLVIGSDNKIWASHPYRGVYRLQLSADKRSVTSRTYTGKDGLPGELNNYVYNIKGTMVVATPKGLYEYNERNDRFAPSTLLPPELKDRPIEYITEDTEGNVWFESEKRTGVIDYHKPSVASPYSILFFPELTGQLARGFEYIYPYNQENIFIGSETGIYHLNYKKYVGGVSPLHVIIGKVRATGKVDTVLSGGYTHNNAVLENEWNSFHFEFSAPAFGQQSNVEYSYQLEGFDDSWSPWSSKTDKDYTNLHYGNYTFKVKARNNHGTESVPALYSFIIEPAWYQSWWAKAIYLAFFCGVAFYGVKWQQRKFSQQRDKHAREQEHIKYMHQLEQDRNEKEIVKLQNEKLESDVAYKNKELANATMHLVERGKVLSKIKDELIHIEKSLSNKPVGGFKRVITILNEAEKNDVFWDQFVTHFDQVYNNFLRTLKSKFPSLTSTDLKLCAYLRMNLSSKEISQLMNISVRGVEIARYRLRKKLEISTEDNLPDFLTAIEREIPG